MCYTIMIFQITEFGIHITVIFVHNLRMTATDACNRTCDVGTISLHVDI